MEMPGIEEYLLQIRKMVGPTCYIIVPDTPAYFEVLQKLNDKYIITKRPNMDLLRLGSIIKR